MSRDSTIQSANSIVRDAVRFENNACVKHRIAKYVHRDFLLDSAGILIGTMGGERFVSRSSVIYYATSISRSFRNEVVFMLEGLDFNNWMSLDHIKISHV